MDWKSVELQIENLVPGFLVLGGLIWVTGTDVGSAWPTKNGFLNAALLVAASYALGLLSSYLTRYAIDSISERGPRKWIFRRNAHVSRSDAKALCEARDSKFRVDLGREMDKRASPDIELAQWNAIYRSAIRKTNRKTEVDRRRAQGRLLRNLALPIGLGAFQLTVVALDIDRCVDVALGLVAALAAIGGLVLLYAYSEYVNFAEAWDIGEMAKTALEGGVPTDSDTSPDEDGNDRA